MTLTEYSERLTQTTTDMRRHKRGLKSAKARLKALQTEAKRDGIVVAEKTTAQDRF